MDVKCLHINFSFFISFSILPFLFSSTKELTSFKKDPLGLITCGNVPNMGKRFAILFMLIK